MSRSRKLVVHFTTHACLVADPSAQPLWETEVGWMESSQVAAKFRNASVRHGCSHDHRRVMRPDRDRFTNLIRRVTCEACRERYARQLADFDRDAFADGSGKGRRVGSLEDALWLVWRRCCSSVGAPSLLDDQQMLGRRQNEVANLVWRHLNVRRVALGGVTSKTLTELFDAIPESLREALQPAIDDLTMAGDLLVEVERLTERAGVFVDGLALDINTGAAVVDLDGILDHMIALDQERFRAYRREAEAEAEAKARAS